MLLGTCLCPQGEAACPHVPLLPFAPVMAELSSAALASLVDFLKEWVEGLLQTLEGIVRASLHWWSKLGEVSCVPERHEPSLLV